MEVLSPPDPANAYYRRTSIDRAAEHAAQLPRTPARRSGEARKQTTGGGRSGGAMMLMSLIGTAAGLAGTYFLVKELKKTTDEASTAAQ